MLKLHCLCNCARRIGIAGGLVDCDTILGIDLGAALRQGGTRRSQAQHRHHKGGECRHKAPEHGSDAIEGGKAGYSVAWLHC